jgi:hypothetical protein
MRLGRVVLRRPSRATTPGTIRSFSVIVGWQWPGGAMAQTPTSDSPR